MRDGERERRMGIDRERETGKQIEREADRER